MEIKYVCFSGRVRSISDGDYHFIQARRLPQLYKVDPALCIFMNTEKDRFRPIGYKQGYLIELYPDSSGKYILPEVVR